MKPKAVVFFLHPDPPISQGWEYQQFVLYDAFDGRPTTTAYVRAVFSMLDASSLLAEAKPRPGEVTLNSVDLP